MFKSLSRAAKRKSKVVELPKAPEPRPLADIETEHAQVCVKAGMTQYHIKVLQSELDTLNNQLIGINREAAARKELDATKTEET